MYEIRDWKQPGCSLSVKVAQLSAREPFSREINETHGEGGALNANYQTAEALAVASNALGEHGIVYGVDFVFKTAGDAIVFDFCDSQTMRHAAHILGGITRLNIT